MGKCSELQMTSPLEPLSQCCSNFIWSLPGAGEWKFAKMVLVHWPRWLPCPYMVKPLKIFSKTEDALCWIFAYIIRVGRSIKFAKIMVVHWHLTFLRQGRLRPNAFVWEKCSEFQTTSPESLGQCCSNFIWNLLGTGAWKMAKMLPSTDQDGHHSHICKIL